MLLALLTALALSAPAAAQGEAAGCLPESTVGDLRGVVVAMGDAPPPPAPPTLREALSTALAAVSPDTAAVLGAIASASVSQRQAVLADAALMKQIAALKGAPGVLAMSSLLEGSQRWVNPPSNDFFAHFIDRGGTAALGNAASMNCWESILYAAFLSGDIDGAWIRAFYRNVMASADPNGTVWSQLGFVKTLPRYTAAGPAAAGTAVPRPGQLLFWYEPGGAWPDPSPVAISLGGDQAISLWNQPSNNNRVQRIRVSELPGAVFVGDAPW